MKLPTTRVGACAVVAALLALLALVPSPAAAQDDRFAPFRGAKPTPPPSLADMQARENKYTYQVDMSQVAARNTMAPTAATWRDECLAHEIEDTSVGWVRDRTHFCNHAEDLMLSVIDNGTGSPGVVWFDWLVYGVGSTGSGSQRTLTIHQELLNVEVDADFPMSESTPISMYAACSVQTPKPVKLGACNTANVVTKTIEGWQSEPYAAQALWSQDLSPEDQLPTGEGQENVVMVGFTPTVTLIGPAIAGKQRQASAASDVPPLIPEQSFNAYARFDSAQYLSTKKGATFRGVVPHLNYDLSGERVKELAAHIEEACDPDRVNGTYPPYLEGDKFIPGCDSDHLLHRLTSAKGGENQERYNANSNAKDRNCNAGTPSTPTPGSKDCDEFPFASTYEGAAASERPTSEFAGGGKPNQFSIKRIDSTQNQNGGRDLNTWYNQDRILDWASGGSCPVCADGKWRDGFWVRISSAS
ncbi:NucA/NucB deoxyribonuclease domain-containing protein [Actinomadura geliboluensis]|uniref:NucA/NucB deoxyribonuclease domain-containing protein n=1 Tax=Actinomadura geliboluensis TaxID=882440 RepID=UPI002630C6D1|nr:hypothetical protein [Actinomadura geliboluensis]